MNTGMRAWTTISPPRSISRSWSGGFCSLWSNWKILRRWWCNGTLAVFDIEESGKQIGEKLFLHLNEEQKNALMQYILEQGVCHGTVFNSCHTLPNRKRPLIYDLTRKIPLSISAPTTPTSKGDFPLMPSSTPTSATRPTQTTKRAAWSLILQRGVSLSVWPPHTARNAGKQRDDMPKRTTPPTDWNDVGASTSIQINWRKT